MPGSMPLHRAFDIILAMAAKTEQRLIDKPAPAETLAEVDLAMHVVTQFARAYCVDKIKTPRRD